MTERPLDAGRAALRRRAWKDAYALLSAADEAGELAPEDLEALGEAAWVTAHYEESLRARERAYAAYVGRDERQAAAAIALMLVNEYFPRGELAVAAGWQKTAERLLEGLEECRAHGLLAWLRAQLALLLARDLDTAQGQGRE